MAQDEPEVVETTDPELSPAALAEWARNLSLSTGEPDTELNADDQAKEEGDGKPNKPSEETTAASAKEDRPVLLAKDGKHIIPYERLEESNAKRDAAEKLAEERQAKIDEQNARIAELEASVKAGTAAADAGKEAPAASPTADEIEQNIAQLEAGVTEMREDGSEWMAQQQEIQIKTLRSLLTRQQAIERQEAERQKQAEADAKEQREHQERTVAQQVQDAIDQVPALKHWQQSKPAFFAAAGEIDKELRVDPAWQNKPYKERFDEVAKRMVAEYGETILPPGSAKPPKKELPDLGVKSLTDLPGGTPTSQSALERAQTASTLDISREFEKMKPDEILRAVMRG